MAEKHDTSTDLSSQIGNFCNEIMKDTFFMILLIKNNLDEPTVSIEVLNKAIKYSKIEYNVAKKVGIPIFVFIHNDLFNEYKSYCESLEQADFKFKNLVSKDLATFVHSISQDKPFIYVFPYSVYRDIEVALKRQWTGLFNKYLKDAKRTAQSKNEFALVNPFKLFYVRRASGITIQELSSKSGVKQSEIHKLEDAGIKKNRDNHYEFKHAKLEELQKLANALDCDVGSLKAGFPDDFMALYVSFYKKNKGAPAGSRAVKSSKSLFQPKAIVFDFDGTLTKPKGEMTTWQRIWLALGYNLDVCTNLHSQYSRYEITHRQWCELTKEKFKQRHLSKMHLDKVADEIVLIDGCEQVIQELVKKNIKLYICSGSIDYIIKRVMKNLYDKFNGIESNKFIFNTEGEFVSIIGTKFDFEGKSNFINQVSRNLNVPSYEILFVGNSINDEWASQSGAITLCINPSLTDADNPNMWSHCIKKAENLKEIFQYFKI